MPTKTTKTGRTYEVDGKKFAWFPLDDDDQPKTAPIRIPLRMKLGTVLELNATEAMDAHAMMRLLERLAPGQQDAIEDMDLNDFQVMFETWQFEYQLLTGATPGESQSSSA